MKKIAVALICFFGVTSVFASVCTDIRIDLSRRQENTSVMSLQKFLFEKGFLQVAPNGYFGVSTFSSVKAYQKSVGLSQIGAVGPATRASIKKESCTTSNTPSIQVITPGISSKKEIVKVIESKPKTPSEERNSRRVEGVETILHGLYNQFLYSGGVIPVPVIDSPLELCVVPQSIIDSNATATVPVLPCANFVDITKLSPYRLKNIPRDPSLATSSTLIGYTVTRNSYNDVSVIAKNVEGGITIKASCNFNSSCTDVQRIANVFYDVPSVASTSRSMLIKNSSLTAPLIIYGKNFTATNTVILVSSYLNKKYTLGVFPSSDKITIPLESKYFNRSTSCVSSCSEDIPLGEYEVMVSNNGGSSNVAAHVSFKGYTTTSVSSANSIKPNTKSTKIASFMISVDIPVTVKSITLTATNTSSVLLTKISHLTIKDASTGGIVGTGSGVIPLTNQILSVNQPKVYDLYADVDTMAFGDVGSVTYAGSFTVTDLATNGITSADIVLPGKDLMFIISY